MKCPKCSQTDVFHVQAYTMVLVDYDEEFVETIPGADLDWDDDTFTFCPQCGQTGTYDDFASAG